MKHKQKNEIKLGKSEEFTEDIITNMIMIYEIRVSLERKSNMEIIEKNAKVIKEWLEHVGFEYEHPGYGKDVYKKLDEIIEEVQKLK